MRALRRSLPAQIAAWTLALCAGGASAAADRSAYEAEARALLEKLIALDSSREGRQVRGVAELLAAEFRAAGFAAADIHILPLADSASLVVRYRGRGRAARPILLLGHMDVVPARRSDWQRDPFKLVEENGFFFGRGVSDNKDGVATIVTTLKRLKREKFQPARDLIVYFSGDEESAQFTTLDTARNHRALIDAEFALNTDGGGGTLDEATGKPLHYGLQTAEKTYADFDLVARNPGGHSSTPRADNAIYELSNALVRLEKHRFPVMRNEATIASLKLAGETTPGLLGEMLRRFAANPLDTEAADALFLEPSYVGQTRTTCVATMLSGGHAPNALAQTATATVNCRIFPGMPVAVVQQTLQKIAGERIDIKLQAEPFWSDASPLRDDVLAAVKQSVHAVIPGVRIVPSQASGATDGAVFRNIGIPTYGVSGIFMKNSDNFAHGLNERVPVQAFYDGLEIWYRLVKNLANAPRSRATETAAAGTPARLD